MAEDYEKTEPPTAKKLSDARKKGHVAKSQDLTIALLLFMSMLVFFFYSGYMYDKLRTLVVVLLSNLNYPFQDPAVVTFWLRQGLYQFLLILFPMFATVFLVGLLSNLLQVGFVFSFFPIAPHWSRLNIFSSANYKRYFSLDTLLKIFLGQIRFIYVSAASWFIISHNVFAIYTLTRATPIELVRYVNMKSLQVGFALAGAYVAFALIDLFYQRWKYYKEMKMTRRELKDELRTIEGNLQIKSKMRSFIYNMLHYPIHTRVKGANILIVDQQQKQALAFIYNRNQMAAPICVAKGSGKRAKQIVQAAQSYNIPVVINDRLASKMFSYVEMGRYVPPSFYTDLALAFSNLKDFAP